MEDELWKDIEGYEELYQISNLGRVKSLERKIKYLGNRCLLKKEKILKQRNRRGYLFVSLSKKNIAKNKNIHQLIASAFIENPNSYKCVNHKDGNKQNNRVENLEWCTHRDNIRHAWDNGLMENFRSSPSGEKSGRSKLTKEQVLEIREKYIPRKYSTRKLAKEYGVSQSAISSVLRLKTWKELC